MTEYEHKQSIQKPSKMSDLESWVKEMSFGRLTLGLESDKKAIKKVVDFQRSLEGYKTEPSWHDIEVKTAYKLTGIKMKGDGCPEPRCKTGDLFLKMGCIELE